MSFKACILLVNKGDPLLVNKGDPDACFKEKLTEVEVLYKNRSRRLTQPLTEHLYIFQFNAEVTSNELLFEFKLKNADFWKIGECGLVQHLEVPSC